MRHQFAHMPAEPPPPSRMDETISIVLAYHGWSGMTDADAAALLMAETGLSRDEIALRLDRAMSRAREIWRGEI